MSPRPSAAQPNAQAAPGVAEQDVRIELAGRAPVQARIYGDKVAGGGPLVLHFHGGTFVCGDLDDGRMVARLLAASGAVVVSLEYPLAPEASVPSASLYMAGRRSILAGALTRLRNLFSRR